MKKLGFGTMRLPLLNPEDPKSIDLEQFQQMTDHFLSMGFTYFDTAYPYHQETSELAVKAALVDRHPRSRYLLANKMPIIRVKKPEDYRMFFEEQLKKCGVDYFDYYLLHNMGIERYGNTEKFGGFDFVSRMKEKGYIGQIGVSFHDNAQLLEKMLREHPEIDFVQLQINYLDWESPVIQSRQNYELCCKYGKKVVVMEPIKGGTLANLPQEALDEIGTLPSHGSPASYAVRYAASLDNVMMVLSGMSTMDQLLDNTSYMKDFAPLNTAERQVVSKITDILNRTIEVPCTSCKYCMEECPKNINIPSYFGLYNQYSVTGSKSNMYYERAATGHGKAKDCLHCGKCEHICPQHIEIRKYLDKFAELYREQEDQL